MRTAILAASAAALALCAGPSLAAKTHAMGATAAAPKQPIPYAELNAYMKATPKQRATRDWWSGAASTGAAANTSASTSTAGADEPKPTDAPAAAPATTSSSASEAAPKTDAPTPDPAAAPAPPK